jgi:hypothetical protein
MASQLSWRLDGRISFSILLMMIIACMKPNGTYVSECMLDFDLVVLLVYRGLTLWVCDFAHSQWNIYVEVALVCTFRVTIHIYVITYECSKLG